MLKLICLLSILFLCSCEPLWDNTPKADIQFYGGYWYQDGSIACCYDYTLDGRQSENVFRLKWEYLCDDATVSIKTQTVDNVWWMESGNRWVKLTVWNDDGQSDSKIKFLTVK